MVFKVHRPYPGVALVETEEGSVLFGAPADAFKATKSYCEAHSLAFPRELVAPQRMLANAAPQFNPEFFIYDFLYIHGAAFKPELRHEKLKFYLDSNQIAPFLEALRITLNGPTRSEMTAYRNEAGQPAMAPETVERLAAVSETMGLRSGDQARELSDVLDTFALDAAGTTQVANGRLEVERNGNKGFSLRSGSQREDIDLSIESRVIPYATLPIPTTPQRPLTFGIKPLGTRSGFDLSGPTTGFLIWVNGRAVIYDGPVGTRYLLESQGISPEDVDAIILSHCHEDHMGAFVELFLAGYQPKVYTAEPIYRSALIKLSSYFKQPPEQVAKLIRYERVIPGQPIEELGARFDFFYTVHSIPTIGVRVSMRDRSGKTFGLQISGDTMHHDGLHLMAKEGVISQDTADQMLNLVPPTPERNIIYYADVGESVIHGHPKDWADNPNQVIYYHCPDNAHTRSYGKHLAVPGGLTTLIDAPKLHPAIPGQLLNAIRFLDLDDTGWIQSLLFRGHVRLVEPGEILLDPTHKDDHGRLTVIISGTAEAKAKGDNSPIVHLCPGEFFGVLEWVDTSGHPTATITAKTPMELFELNANTIKDYVERNNLGEVLSTIRANRPLVERAQIFQPLDTAMRNQIAKASNQITFHKGDTILEQGGRSDDFYILLEGTVEVYRAGRIVATISAEEEDNFFGEFSALNPKNVRSATVKAATDGRSLQVHGGQLRHLFEQHMGVRYTLMCAVENRKSQKS
jgi:CRP-like cAMP-binding protein